MKRILLTILLSCSVLFATPSYNQLLDGALNDVSNLEKQLEKAEKATRTTKSQLGTAVVELTESEVQLGYLQKTIDAETKELNKQITLALEYKEKYDKTEEKLAWWHKIAAYITIGILCYVGFIALKAAGKI